MNRIEDIAARILPHFPSQQINLINSVCLALSLMGPFVLPSSTTKSNTMHPYLEFLAHSAYPFHMNLPHPINNPPVMRSDFGKFANLVTYNFGENSVAFDIDMWVRDTTIGDDIKKRRTMYNNLALLLFGGDEKNASLRRLFVWAIGKVLSRGISNTPMINEIFASEQLLR